MFLIHFFSRSTRSAMCVLMQ